LVPEKILRRYPAARAPLVCVADEMSCVAVATAAFSPAPCARQPASPALPAAAGPSSAAAVTLLTLPDGLLTRIARHVYGIGGRDGGEDGSRLTSPHLHRLAPLRACCRATRAAVDALGVAHLIVRHRSTRARR
jgi:hypothetical protein